MEFKVERLLPIGSIVRLRNSEKKVMIIGFCVAPKINEKNEVFDYMGCMWPEGVIDSDKNIVFNEEDILEVLSKGEYNEEEANFKKRLAELISNSTNKIEEQQKQGEL